MKRVVTAMWSPPVAEPWYFGRAFATVRRELFEPCDGSAQGTQSRPGSTMEGRDDWCREARENADPAERTTEAASLEHTNLEDSSAARAAAWAEKLRGLKAAVDSSFDALEALSLELHQANGAGATRGDLDAADADAAL